MNIAERIQTLRKSKGISQEQLANEMGVSRQAVSKWESEQSIPDLDKVIAMSEYFDVTTDYILKGIEKETNTMKSKGLYIGSTILLAVGLLYSSANWYENQSAVDILGGLIIQAVGIACYFIGTIISSAKATFFIKWLNVIIVLFIPTSLNVAIMSKRFLAPYPTDIISGAIFLPVYAFVIFIAYILMKKISSVR